MAVRLSALRAGRCFTPQKHYFYASGTRNLFILFYMQIIDCVSVELHTDRFGGTELKRNYTWGFTNITVETRCVRGR
jgi:hypothetical protein